ncbi:hypothetical protein BDR07DRAFT_1480750 [Suillus spraguei]|nr:hypothetical protein BDR07DRAFT_1480750 [Suillus spraguei]
MAASTDADDPSMLSFHSIPSFGKGAIQCFPSNVSNVKQRAVQHFKDVLQCAIPAFEGLFPDSHDEVVHILLFCLAEWHAIAKLGIHTDNSLDLLSQATRCLGQQLRKFWDFTCSAFRTMELPGKIAAHQKKSANLNSAGAGTGSPGARLKAFNMQTYKLHALGDYVSSIKMFGTTDSYTTQIDDADKDEDIQDDAGKDEDISKDCNSDVDDSDDCGSDSDNEGSAFKF